MKVIHAALIGIMLSGIAGCGGAQLFLEQGKLKLKSLYVPGGMGGRGAHIMLGTRAGSPASAV